MTAPDRGWFANNGEWDDRAVPNLADAEARSDWLAERPEADYDYDGLDERWCPNCGLERKPTSWVSCRICGDQPAFGGAA